MISESRCESGATQKVRIWSGEHRCYWRPEGAGYTKRWEEAGLFDRAQAEEWVAKAGRSKKLELREVTALSNRRQPCKCTGSCSGPEGLGEGWVCCLTLPPESRSLASEAEDKCPRPLLEWALEMICAKYDVFENSLDGRNLARLRSYAKGQNVIVP